MDLKKLKEEFDLASYKILYPDINEIVSISIFGNETRPRLRIVFSRLDGGRNKLVSFPKALVEANLGKILSDGETVDHINNDPLDNRIENLQILSRSENIKKQHRDGLAYKPPKNVPLSCLLGENPLGMKRA